jgi:hypothetical protein
MFGITWSAEAGSGKPKDRAATAKRPITFFARLGRNLLI